MRFEDQVAVLCAKALATDDDIEVRHILTELRTVLHQHIEELRSGLVTYTASVIRRKSVETIGSACLDESHESTIDPDQPGKAPRTWRQVVQLIASERDQRKALQLSVELSRLLQHGTEASGQM
jgi:hypothetical protein